MEQFNYTTNNANNQSFRKNHFNHLTYTDRINIEQLLLLKNNPDYVGEKISLDDFIRQFTARTDMSPSAYRKANGQKSK